MSLALFTPTIPPHSPSRGQSHPRTFPPPFDVLPLFPPLILLLSLPFLQRFFLILNKPLMMHFLTRRSSCMYELVLLHCQSLVHVPRPSKPSIHSFPSLPPSPSSRPLSLLFPIQYSVCKPPEVAWILPRGLFVSHRSQTELWYEVDAQCQALS